MKAKQTILIASLVYLFSSFSAQAEHGCVGVVPATLHTHFWKTLVQGAKSAAKDLNIVVRVRSSLLEKDTVAQRKIIRILKEKGCEAFVIAPVDVAINTEVEALLDVGIPSVYVDRGTDGTDQTKAIVSTHNYLAGFKAGEEMVRILGDKGNVAVLRLHKDINTTNHREQGFIDAVERFGLKVVLNEYLGISYGSAYREARKLGDRIRKVDGIFTSNESVTQGVFMSLSEDASKPFPLHIGFDLNDRIADGIKDSRIHGVIIQDPYQMGYQGVELALDAMNGKTFDKTIRTPIHFVTQKSLAHYIPEKTP